MSELNRIARELSSRGSVLSAGLIAVLLVAVTAILFPVAERPLTEVKPFLPIFATTIFITEYLTAYMLLTHFRSVREAFFGALAAASIYVAVMAVVQIAIFPGVFSDTGLLGAGPQSAVWIWTLWHGGYPAFVLLALVLRMPSVARGHEEQLPRIGLGIVLLAPLAAIALAWLAVAGGGILPPLIDGSSYTKLVQSPAAVVVVSLNLIALIACVVITRLRDVLSAWLAVAILASLADVVLTLAASARFSLGWYAARCLSVVSSSVVLGVLVWQTSNLYRQLAHAHRALGERAILDALTGIYNRGHFIDQFPRDVRRAQREQAPLALILVDVDHFKAYNDSFGHPQGDECLRAVAHAMQRALKRPADYLARYGGEEFVVVLPHTDAEGAMHIANAIRDAVAALRIPAATADRIVTVSVGLSTFDPEKDDYKTDVIIRRADDALYHAKRTGRDRIVSFDDMHAEALVTGPSN